MEILVKKNKKRGTKQPISELFHGKFRILHGNCIEAETNILYNIGR